MLANVHRCQKVWSRNSCGFILCAKFHPAASHLKHCFRSCNRKYFLRFEMTNTINGNILSNLSEPEQNMDSENIHNNTYAEALKKGACTHSQISNSQEEESPMDLNLNTDRSSDSVIDFQNQTSDASTEDDKHPTTTETIDNCESSYSEATEDFNSVSEEQGSSEVRDDIGELVKNSSNSETVSETPIDSNDKDESLSHSDKKEKDLKRKWISSSSESSSYEEEESEEMLDITDVYPTAVKWQLRESNPKLPETVTVLQAPNGSKVYLVGTAHFSLESQEDVSKTIRATQPDVVMLELCKSRVNILSFDEETIMEEFRTMGLAKVRAAIEQNGVMRGLLYILLLNMSAHITKELGMAPGGEFRRAFAEAKKVPGCAVQLGDRSIHITLQRALSTLSFWKKLKIGWYMLRKESISKEDVEKCKQQDLLLELLAKMTGEFPEVSKVFVEERDTYLAYSLQMAALPVPSHVSPGGLTSTVVVGVVGIGHVPGIVNKWNNVTEADIAPLLRIPEQSVTSKVIHKAIRYSVYGLLAYGCYRVLPGRVTQKPIDLISSVLTYSQTTVCNILHIRRI